MFDRGLLVTFIPEILMVIGYLLCLFVPKTQTESTTDNFSLIKVQIPIIEAQNITTFIFPGYDFQTTAEVILKEEQPLPCLTQYSGKTPFESLFGCSDGLTFKEFSHPPPSFIS